MTTEEFITELFYRADEKLKKRAAASANKTRRKFSRYFGFIVCFEDSKQAAFLPMASA